MEGTDIATIGVTIQDGSTKSSAVNVETGKKKKVPRRILHFSDGILEEYSTDEEEEEPPVRIVDPRTLTWFPWFWHYVTSSARMMLNSADFCGEKLAWMFGITSPKYQYAIDEYNKIKAEEERERQEEEAMRNKGHAKKLSDYSAMEGAIPIDKAFVNKLQTEGAVDKVIDKPPTEGAASVGSINKSYDDADDRY